MDEETEAKKKLEKEKNGYEQKQGQNNKNKMSYNTSSHNSNNKSIATIATKINKAAPDHLILSPYLVNTHTTIALPAVPKTPMVVRMRATRRCSSGGTEIAA